MSLFLGPRPVIFFMWPLAISSSSFGICRIQSKILLRATLKILAAAYWLCFLANRATSEIRSLIDSHSIMSSLRTGILVLDFVLDYGLGSTQVRIRVVGVVAHVTLVSAPVPIGPLDLGLIWFWD